MPFILKINSFSQRWTQLSLTLATAWVLSACVSLPTQHDSAAPAPGAQVDNLEQNPEMTPAGSGLSGASTAPASPAPTLGIKPQIWVGELSPLDRRDAHLDYERTVASLAAPEDLWQRIRSNFSMPDLDGALVRQHEQWYSKRPEYLRRMAERSRKYLFHIVEEIERRNMPAELALLPYIESAFNPQAVSPAKAAGMWQFMPTTGKNFNLKQNMLRDDRRDVLASTRAALDYLQYLHRMFGDWHLALAAYNWGEGNVSRAIRKNRQAGKSTQYADLKMPAETRNYVPKLQALKNIIVNPQNFEAELPLVENHPYFQSVELDRDMDAAIIARLAEIDIEDFHALNPSHKKPVLFAAGTPTILLPWDNATLFRQNLQDDAQGQFASWTVWLAPHTMTAAEAAQRTGMSEAELRRVNHIPARMKIQRGSALIVPRTDNQGRDVSSHIVQTASLSLAPESGSVRKITVRARAGDTIAKIAARHKVRAADLAAWNKIALTSKLKKGQALTIHQSIAIKTRTVTAKKSIPKNNKKSTPKTTAPKKAVTSKSSAASKNKNTAK